MSYLKFDKMLLTNLEKSLDKEMLRTNKAGAYAIQGGCVIYIKEIRGEYSNVVGLPVARLYQELSRMESNEPSDGSE